MTTSGSSSSKPASQTSSTSFATLAKRYWLPTLLVVLAVIFIVQNTNDIGIHLFNRTLQAPAWIVYTVLVLGGVVIGAFAQRRRTKRRAGL